MLLRLLHVVIVVGNYFVETLDLFVFIPVILGHNPRQPSSHGMSRHHLDLLNLGSMFKTFGMGGLLNLEKNSIF